MFRCRLPRTDHCRYLRSRRIVPKPAPESPRSAALPPRSSGWPCRRRCPAQIRNLPSREPKPASHVPPVSIPSVSPFFRLILSVRLYALPPDRPASLSSNRPARSTLHLSPRRCRGKRWSVHFVPRRRKPPKRNPIPALALFRLARKFVRPLAFGRRRHRQTESRPRIQTQCVSYVNPPYFNRR